MPTNRKTYLDIAKAQDPQGNPALVIETMSRMYPIIYDLDVAASNADMGNETTVRTGLPAVARVSFNQGVAPTKSSKTKRVDTIGMWSGRSEVDEKLTVAFGEDRIKQERMNEDAAFEESLGQAMTTDIFYGDENVDSRGFTGLAPRMPSLASSLNGSQVKSHQTVSGGDGTSIYIVDHGRRGLQAIYPKNGDLNGAGGGKLAAAGLRVKDLGKQPVSDTAGNSYLAFTTEYLWAMGLTVQDPRHIARLANIDVSDAISATPAASLYESLSSIFVRMAPQTGMHRVIYCCRDLIDAFMRQQNNKGNLHLTKDEFLGEEVLTYKGCPIRAVDAIATNESTVT